MVTVLSSPIVYIATLLVRVESMSEVTDAKGYKAIDFNDVKDRRASKCMS
jgi:hypothetical protein